MLYLLDASVLITAHNGYYALNRVPEFWEWLAHHGDLGRVKLPPEIYAEVEDGNDALADWMSDTATRDALLFTDQPDGAHLQTVLGCYGPTFTEEDLITIGKDPFLIAAAMPSPQDRLVVTAEVSKPSRRGPRRHIPNVCQDCGVQSVTPIDFLNALDFSTDWNN